MNIKKYSLTMLICLSGTQISGLIFGTSFFLIELYHPHLAEGELLKVIPICLAMGTFVTIIPSLFYSMIMSFLILKNQQKERSQWFDFGISIFLVATVYYIALFIVHGSRAMGILGYPLIIPALVAGIVGVAVTHRYLNKNKKNHAQPVE